MEKKKKNCGNPVTSDEKFCHNCGIALSSVVVQNSSRKTTSDSEQQPEEPAAQEIRATDGASLQDAGRTKFCRFCGNPVREGAKFCRSCGQALTTDILHSEKQQLEKSGCTKRAELPFQKAILSDDLPLTIGGGIGQSRICMFFLRKAHIGEVQSSLWPKDVEEAALSNGIQLL